MNGGSRVNVKAEKVYVTTFRTLPLFLSYFGENSSHVNGLSVCIFVALCVRMSVAGANKVEGTMS